MIQQLRGIILSQNIHAHLLKRLMGTVRTHGLTSKTLLLLQRVKFHFQRQRPAWNDSYGLGSPVITFNHEMLRIFSWVPFWSFIIFMKNEVYMAFFFCTSNLYSQGGKQPHFSLKTENVWCSNKKIPFWHWAKYYMNLTYFP